jgi:uncharacterized Rossmann fold enzyme
MKKERKRVDALEAKLEVSYCIPNWLRDEQIRMSCELFKNRIKPEPLKDEPLALVCFGPSLNNSWERLKDFKHVMTCSGSHKFLMDRGITPEWHVDVDPRAHKLELIGDKVSKDTKFLMASCVHPQVFDHLVKHGANIILWHTYSGEAKDNLPLVYPRGEWVSTGGANVGLRALVLARMLGYRDIHIFGMDGSFEPGKSHASHHPNAPKDYIIATLNGKEYSTTTAFLECGRSTIHELEMLPDVKATFYGSGLVQDMVKAKQGEMKMKKKSTIAFYISPTISDEYAEQNRLLHKINPTYGVSVLAHLDTIKKLYEVTESKSILDYGCGKGMLAKNLEFPIFEYDPAISGKDSPPRPADLVICVDVLEHIEPDFLNAVLNDISRCTKKIAFLVISTRAAVKTLPDGRNTHLIQEKKDWWKEKLSNFFIIPDDGIKENDGKLHVIATQKERPNISEKFVIEEKLQEVTNGAVPN